MATPRTAPAVSKLAQAASTALAHASAKLAGEPTEPNVVEEIAPDIPVNEVSQAEADALRKAYRRAERRVETAREALEAAKADILAAMGAAEVLQVAETGKPFAEHKTVTSLVFDQTRYRAEHPEQAAGYMKPRTQRRFKVLT